jgi:hypothetical protein
MAQSFTGDHSNFSITLRANGTGKGQLPNVGIPRLVDAYISWKHWLKQPNREGIQVGVYLQCENGRVSPDVKIFQ